MSYRTFGILREEGRGKSDTLSKYFTFNLFTQGIFIQEYSDSMCFSIQFDAHGKIAFFQALPLPILIQVFAIIMTLFS